MKKVLCGLVIALMITGCDVFEVSEEEKIYYSCEIPTDYGTGYILDLIIIHSENDNDKVVLISSSSDLPDGFFFGEHYKSYVYDKEIITYKQPEGLNWYTKIPFKFKNYIYNDRETLEKKCDYNEGSINNRSFYFEQKYLLNVYRNTLNMSAKFYCIPPGGSIGLNTENFPSYDDQFLKCVVKKKNDKLL